MTTECPYDPFSAEVLQDPFPAYREAREQCPVAHYTGRDPDFYTAFRYEDVVDIMMQPDIWTSRYGNGPGFTRGVGFNSDGPEHRKFRKAVLDILTPRNVKGYTAEIQSIVDDLTGHMAELSGGDFYELFAAPLPTILIARLIGIKGDLTHFAELSDALMEKGMNDSDPSEFRRILAELDTYWDVQLEPYREILKKLENPGLEHIGAELPDDIISRLLVFRADDGSGLSEFEIYNTLMNLLLGGNETTTSLLTNLVWRLTEDRSRWEAVRDDRSLLPAAIEESLRFDAPALGMFRTSLEEVEVDGTTIPPKKKLQINYAAANHDPRTFDDPDEFRLDRAKGELARHISFGKGTHACPGAGLARLEVTIAMNALLDRFPDIRLDGAPARNVPFNFWGRRYLPLAW